MQTQYRQRGTRVPVPPDPMTGDRDSGDHGGWLVHDVLIGSLAGSSVGLVVGLMVLPRLDSEIGSWLAVGGLALVAIVALRWERNRRRGIGPVTVMTWIATAISLLLVALLVTALRSFT
ncbi:MAG: hypothetical protein GY926_27260 [bacterium]|nr:hypothetical protein [bacterium]